MNVVMTVDHNIKTTSMCLGPQFDVSLLFEMYVPHLRKDFARFVFRVVHSLQFLCFCNCERLFCCL